MSAYKDAQANNDITRNVRQYSDIDLFFGRKSTGSDISKVTDIQAVKRSVRNLVLLNAYEKPFHPEIAGGVREMLFELMTPITAQIIAKQVEIVINNFKHIFDSDYEYNSKYHKKDYSNNLKLFGISKLNSNILYKFYWERRRRLRLSVSTAL